MNTPQPKKHSVAITEAAILAALNAHADATRNANGYPPGPHAPDLDYYGQITRDSMEAALQAAWVALEADGHSAA